MLLSDNGFSQAEKQEIENLRTGVINNLHTIYTSATKIVVLDSFLLRLHSGGMIDAAIILCLGRWITRLWTLTEAKLAKKLILKTEDSIFDLDDILLFLYDQINNEENRYFKIFTRLVYLRPTPPGHQHKVYHPLKPGLRTRDLFVDIYESQLNRYDDVSIDQARALFPLLGLKWQTGWTLQDGLRYIAQSYQEPEDVAILKRYCSYRSIALNL